MLLRFLRWLQRNSQPLDAEAEGYMPEMSPGEDRSTGTAPLPDGEPWPGLNPHNPEEGWAPDEAPLRPEIQRPAPEISDPLSELSGDRTG